MRRMSAALRQRLLPRLTAQWLQIVQLAIQPFPRHCTPASVSFFNHALRYRGEYTFCPAQGIAQLRYKPLMRFTPA